MKITQIDWKHLNWEYFLEYIVMVSATPTIIIAFGAAILKTYDLYNEARLSGDLTPVSNEQIFSFNVLSMAVMFVMFGLLWWNVNIQTSQFDYTKLYKHGTKTDNPDQK